MFSQLATNKDVKDLNRTTILAAAILGMAGVELSAMKQPLSQFEKAVTSANMSVINTCIDSLIKNIQHEIKKKE